MNSYSLHIMKMLAVVICMGTLASCDHNRNKPGYSFYPDMENSQAYETYSANPVFADGKTNRSSVPNTVPRGHIPYRFEKTDSDLHAAGKELKNPFAGDETVLAKGQKAYTIYCTMCHGDLGDGQGSLFTSGKYPYPPASLLTNKARSRPDGELFHIISVGYGVMGAHQGQMTPDERWQVVEYIKSRLQR
ncbi:MAG: cytochrome c [Breznakibacter sp.]